MPCAGDVQAAAVAASRPVVFDDSASSSRRRVVVELWTERPATGDASDPVPGVLPARRRATHGRVRWSPSPCRLSRAARRCGWRGLPTVIAAAATTPRSGPWTPTPTLFTNGYFALLKNVKWTPKKWSGPAQFEDPSGKLMMLPSDLLLLSDKVKTRTEGFVIRTNS